MLSEREIEDLIKFIAVQHSEGTDKPRDSCPACMTMDKYLAHRTEILSLAWGYFKLQRIVERGINPTVTVDLRPGGLNQWPQVRREMLEDIRLNKPWWKLFDWGGLVMGVLGFILGLISSHYLH